MAISRTQSSLQAQTEPHIAAPFKTLLTRCQKLITRGEPPSISDGVYVEEKIIIPIMFKLYGSLSETSSTSFTNPDFRRSYVRVDQSANLKGMDVMLAIRSQRTLDPLMKEFASFTPSALTWYFLAPMDGTWPRVLPGSAQRGDDSCRSYELLHGRPRFRTATSVMKGVLVLIDLPASMNNNLSPNIGAGTIPEAVRNIATQLLLTLSAGDQVNIIVFDSTRAIQPAPSAVLFQDHSTTEQVELDPLRLKLSKQTVETRYKQSDLSAARKAALPNFDSDPQASKVILFITDGVFATLGIVTLPSANLTDHIKLFLYKLKQPDDPDVFPSDNSLTRQLCAVGGNFQPILKNLEKPLLDLHKFFSYLANLKLLNGGRPQYKFVYQDFKQTGGNIIVVTKPGDAGVPVFINLLCSLTDAANQELRSKITGYSAPTA